MIYRYFIVLFLLLAALPSKLAAQSVSCVEDYEDLYPGNSAMRRALDEVCRQTRLRTPESYQKALTIIRSITDSMKFPSIALEVWRDSLVAALNNSDAGKGPDHQRVRLGGCCFPDFHCEYISRDACDAGGGKWFEDVSCNSVSCMPPPPPPAGACVLPAGSCLFLPESVCAGQNGVWKGAGVKCEDIEVEPVKADEPVWACCPVNPDEECSMTTESGCKSGNWLFGVKCESTDCQNIPGPESTADGKEERQEISSAELERLKKKGENKLTQFKGHLDVITNRTTSLGNAELAINNAVSLFDSEERKVTVSSAVTGKVIDRKVRDYLKRLNGLSMNNYSKVDITWAKFQYASSFSKGPDGKYYGYIDFEQRFTGYRDGAPVYDDVIRRRVLIVVSKYEKIVDGNKVEEWDVFLGDMAISELR